MEPIYTNFLMNYHPMGKFSTTNEAKWQRNEKKKKGKGRKTILCVSIVAQHITERKKRKHCRLDADNDKIFNLIIVFNNDGSSLL